MNKSPCLNCNDRHNLCHSKCKKYIKFREQREMVHEKRIEEQKYNNYLNDAISRMKGVGYGNQFY